MQIPDNFPDKLVSAINEYLKDHEGSTLFFSDSNLNHMYIDKTIETTTYRVYIKWYNMCVVLSLSECSKPEWSDEEVKKYMMNAWEIKMCYEKSGFFQ